MEVSVDKRSCVLRELTSAFSFYHFFPIGPVLGLARTIPCLAKIILCDNNMLKMGRQIDTQLLGNYSPFLVELFPNIIVCPLRPTDI